ncbi:hypothetical protein [Priestia endophytica]|uniref:Uncharacterized protein n=1 Tax=Priestia endophytica DSM 13796 TaxID=1121089 RepID=A0A1I6C0F5_9BACI|nr:hypothetical protein [Priestia endophytica]KYG33432.1 hypothetical protein AZF06_21545 [Priestia endophytica]SFQ86663.1 hypothetical protein SAMN02745910_04693 [Priestia endophytica DSM 13796]
MRKKQELSFYHGSEGGGPDWNPPSEPLIRTASDSTVYGIRLLAFYLKGATRTQDNKDRFLADLIQAKDVWNFPMFSVTPETYSVGSDFGLPNCLDDVDISGEYMTDLMIFRETHRRLHPVERGVKTITIWYAPFTESLGADVLGRAFESVGGYPFIFMSNAANNGFNNSLLAHEIGHILYFKQSGNIDASDPTDPNGSIHSPQPDNVMFSTPDNNVNLEQSQINKARNSFLFVEIDE